MRLKATLWTRDFIRITTATALGAAGGIASSFALSFLVFDETGSTLASALVLAVRLVPAFLLPLFIAPMMDRFPRKPFLVGGDMVNGILYAAAGLYLYFFSFSYVGYLLFSLVLSCLGAFDELAYNSFYPKVIPEGMTEKGYAVSSMLYPVLSVLVMPLAALLFETVGVANLLLGQAALSLLAALIENGIRVREETRGKAAAIRDWWNDVCEAARYLQREKGLRGIYAYMAMSNGVAIGYSPLLVAFFRTAPGLTTAMYSFFGVAEFAGRTIGGMICYRWHVPERKRFPFVFSVYQTYEWMDMCLLWLPYPLMLANRAICGFLGVNSATLRQAAVQQYIPDSLRARVNAYESMVITAAGSVLSIAIGALGEALDYRWCMTLCGAAVMVVCWLAVFGRRKQIKPILAYQKQE